MAQIPPPGFGPGEEFTPVGTFELGTPPMGNGGYFNDPFNHGNPLPPPMHHMQSEPFPREPERYNDEIAPLQRISTLNLHDGEPRDRSQRRRESSPKQRQSFLARTKSYSIAPKISSFSSTAKASPIYKVYRLEKTGQDWNFADVIPIIAPAGEMEDKIKKARKISGSVSEQLSSMKQKRRDQIYKLLEELNDREKDTGYQWDPVAIEDKDVVISKGSRDIRAKDVVSKGSRDIRAMEVVFKRSSQRPTQTKTQSESYVTKKSNLNDWNKSKDVKKDGKDKAGDNKAKVKDTDPFQSSTLFSSDGLPMDDHGPIHFEDGGLPPHLPKDEPIGKRLRSKSANRVDGRTSAHFGEVGGGQDVIPPPLGDHGDQFDMKGMLYGDGGHDDVRGRGRRDSGVDILPLPIAPRGSLSRPPNRRNTISRSRERSKSRPPRIIYADRREHNYPIDSSVSSNEGGSIMRGEVDEVLSSHTSGSMHEYPPESYGFKDRRYSKHEQSHREHYPGPTYHRPSTTRYHGGEQILVTERRRPSGVRGQRPVSMAFDPRALVPLRVPVRRDSRRSPDLDPYPLSPTSPTRRGGRELAIFQQPHTEFERDRLRESSVDGYMADMRWEQELADRAYRVRMQEREMAERELAEREFVERERRRSKGYFAPGGFNLDESRYMPRERGYSGGGGGGGGYGLPGGGRYGEYSR